MRHRTASVRVFSSNDFKVDLDYDVPEETQLVNHHVTRADQNSNEYNLTVNVPIQVSHSFGVNLVLHHAYARSRKVLHLSFNADAAGNMRAASQAVEYSAPQANYESS